MQYHSRPECGGGQDNERLSRLNNGLVPEGAFLPDICAAEEDYSSSHDPSTVAAMRRLMLAVLEDALRIFQNDADASSGARKRQFDEVEHWLCSPGGNGPFAFDTVCEELGINPGFLRMGLWRWREERRAGKIQSRLKRRLVVARAPRMSVLTNSIDHRRRKAS